ncbi:FAD binding domain-containing protein [Pseudonocardia sp. HH130630-07]|uniref:FAD binding domain-containing protein n=1 Tax=Pseudonocardia sp. HH130630-07 TaxID=1690815 RepID=UPI0008152361|nr:FAD binding domain-containing protein [Pseudonocardia sp. HH130630-07]ANY08960.1 FAD-binding molybdopterin dehydrogenase [Pseudonocardia sp. HH130630-07]
MDIDTVTGFRRARDRADLLLAPGERILGGGTWLFSEPQPEVTGLVDLTTMDWEPIVVRPDGGLEIAATCTIAELAAFGESTGRPLFAQCAHALLASWKIWHTATVGGNVCRSFAAAGMVALCVALDGVAHVWTPDGTDRRVPVAGLVTGNGTNALAPGEVLRALELPAHALAGRTGFRKIALAELGRSGAVLTGRVDAGGGCVFGITAATAAPSVLRYPALPGTGRLRADAGALPGYYTDPLGSADWRRQVSAVLLAEIHEELAA